MSLRKYHNFCFWSCELSELTLSVPCSIPYHSCSCFTDMLNSPKKQQLGGELVRAVKFMSMTMISSGGITLVILFV